jgi:hypothetical protein
MRCLYSGLCTLNFDPCHVVLIPPSSTYLLDYSIVFVPVLSIGHLSTTALAAISLGSMTATVTGLSILVGLCSALDTMLPSAWTSPEPHLVGLWAQRMSGSSTPFIRSGSLHVFPTGVVMTVAFIVSPFRYPHIVAL